jgi:hypothetical protein
MAGPAGLRLIARDALVARRVGSSVLFTGAAALGADLVPQHGQVGVFGRR